MDEAGSIGQKPRSRYAGSLSKVQPLIRLAKSMRAATVVATANVTKRTSD